MSTGGGHAPLAEAMSVLGVPVITKKPFIATEKALGHSWREAFEESMKEAAEEEKRRAIERGSFHEGVPAISAIHSALHAQSPYAPIPPYTCWYSLASSHIALKL